MSHEEFIKIVKDAIYEECIDARIVPSILIAHAIIISDWGTDDVAIKANNLFKIKTSTWYTSRESYTCVVLTETSSGKMFQQEVHYRIYDSWRDSVVDYIARMLSKEKYDVMVSLNTTMECVRKYVELTDQSTPHLESRINNIIQNYQLTQYDYIRGKYNPFNIAQIGDRGEFVKWLQYELSSRGYDIVAPFIGDFFDYPTMAALKNYQRDHDLEPHGIVDLKTLKTLISSN